MPDDGSSKNPLLKIENLVVQFEQKSPLGWPFDRDKLFLKAVDKLSLEIQPGETLAIVGESGCGKSTLARTIIGLNPIHKGQIYWKGKPIGMIPRILRSSQLQIIFQDPLAALNPRWTAEELVSEPLKVQYPNMPENVRREQVKKLLYQVGLPPYCMDKYPHEFSGGQCQRIGIARALIVRPDLLICDEPVSALDVSIQAQIVNLLKNLQKKFNLALLFIAHDLAIVRHVADRIAVMYLGRIVEEGLCEEVYKHPTHPYTQMLLSAIPVADPRVKQAWTSMSADLETELPDLFEPLSGCRFRTRCLHSGIHCTVQAPELKGSAIHRVACFHNAVATKTAVPLLGESL